MKIVFTGGGTGGHFYPIIAVAEALRSVVRENHLIEPRLYFIAPDPFDEEALFSANIAFIKIPAGKLRRYPSLANIPDLFRTCIGILWSLGTLFRLYPDVVFSKGGYASVPTVTAARLLNIPVVIHESDSKPGRANIYASRFAKRIAISFDSSASYFPEKVRGNIARTGIPVRAELGRLERDGAMQYLHLDTTLPTVLILGGSSGSQRINETVLSALPDLVSFTNVLHQTGKAEIAGVTATSSVILEGKPGAEHYHPYAYLSAEAMRQAAGAADIIVSRAGATAIAEIALWKKPALLVPIPESVSHDQRTNAYAYAHTGAAVVIEEANLTPHLLTSEVRRILGDRALAASMAEKGSQFANTDAARIIAEELLTIGLSHEEQPGATVTQASTTAP